MDAGYLYLTYFQVTEATNIESVGQTWGAPISWLTRTTALDRTPLRPRRWEELLKNAGLVRTISMAIAAMPKTPA